MSGSESKNEGDLYGSHYESNGDSYEKAARNRPLLEWGLVILHS
jgi:hypothetical protein